MIYAAHQEVMNLGVERVLHLSRGPRKNNQSMTDRNFLHRKPVTSQPAGDSGQVLLTDPKASSVLGRGKPLVVERRFGIVLCVYEHVQLRLLCLRRL